MSESMHDNVNHPPHYKSAGGIEAIDVIDSLGLGFCLGNAVKYILRSGKKGDAIEDIEKALWYLRRHLAKLRGERDGIDREDHLLNHLRGILGVKSGVSIVAAAQDMMRRLSDREDRLAAAHAQGVRIEGIAGSYVVTVVR